MAKKKKLVNKIRKGFGKGVSGGVKKKKKVEAVTFRKLPEWLLELPELKRQDVTVILLNAHGGLDPKTGKYITAPSKMSPVWDNKKPVHGKNVCFEGVFSRQVNELILYYLRSLQVNAIILNDEYNDTLIASKRFNSLKFARDVAKGECIALEIHANATKEMEGGASGFEFFTYPGKSLSDPMADIYGEEMDREFPSFKHRRTSPGVEKEARFGILKMDPLYIQNGYIPTFTKGIPIVLSENGFMDNKKDCKELLMSPKGRERIAKFHVKGILRIINELY